MTVVDLTKVVKDLKGNVIESVVIKKAEPGSYRALTDESKKALDEFLVTQSEEIREDLILFTREYLRQSELEIHQVNFRDLLQAALTQGFESPKDKVKQARILPKLDDSCDSITFSSSDVTWVVNKIADASNELLGSVLKARLFEVLDPEGEILADYGKDVKPSN